MGPISPGGSAYLVETIGGEEKREELSRLCSVVISADLLAGSCNRTAMLDLPLAEQLKLPDLADLKLAAEKQKLAFVAAEDGIGVEFEKLRMAMVDAGMGVMALDLKRALDEFRGSLDDVAFQRPTVHPIPEPARPDAHSIIHEIRKAEIALAERQAASLQAERDERPGESRFRLDGEKWEIRFGAESGHFGDRKGFAIIAKLLRLPNPTRTISVFELMGTDRVKIDQGGDNQPITDREALKAYDDRLVEVNAELDRAKADNDAAALPRLESERAELLSEIKNATGPGGVLRNLSGASSAVKARNAVWNSLTRAYGRLEKGGLGRLATHLRNSIRREGDGFAYRPDREISWELVKKNA